MNNRFPLQIIDNNPNAVTSAIAQSRHHTDRRRANYIQQEEGDRISDCTEPLVKFSEQAIAKFNSAKSDRSFRLYLINYCQIVQVELN